MRATAILAETNLMAGAGRQLKVRSKIADGQLAGALWVHIAPPDVVVQKFGILN
jgi:hypothetical protein